ncbi:MAG TPA: hypothetical protein PKD86_11515 [Gemmatales bacterium]|nr:hypothetical protein [Gemmatales bacterium]HMP59971.1 hypothetical protein [Gemmatales bacterium]
MNWLMLPLLATLLQAPPASPPSSGQPPALPTEGEALAQIRKAGDKMDLRFKLEIVQRDFGDKELEALVPALMALPNLQEVDLSRTAVTAKGLATLKPVKHLRLLFVIPELQRHAVAEELQKANPKLVLMANLPPPGARPPPVGLQPQRPPAPPPQR